MKFNFKKIVSVLAATIMLGSTISFAAAAWPAPFVSSGTGAAAVVYGANAPSTGGDMAAAINLGAELDKSITATTGTGTTTGDTIKLAKDTDKFNLGEDGGWKFYSTLDEEQLSKVLAEGKYSNDANNEYDYEQSIVLADQINLTHFHDSSFNDDKPVIGFKILDGAHVLNYTLEFTPTAAENTVTIGAGTSSAGDDLETSLLPMLGMDYYIQKVEQSSGRVKMTLLDNANDASVTEGADTTVTVGSNSYNVKINFIDSANTILEVNGVKTNKLAEGGVFKIGTETYVAIKNILYNAKESGISSVEFSIGSGKIALEHGQEVQLNGEAISDTTNSILTAYIHNDTAHSISKIVLKWVVDDDFFVTAGSDLILPGFETIKISMAGFNQPKAESTTFATNGDDKYYLKTNIKDGALNLPILYNNATEILGIGKDSTHKLVTNVTGDAPMSTASMIVRLSEDNHSYFVATWINGKDFESYAYELNSIADNTGKNETTLKNLVSEGSDIVFSEVGKDKERGNIKFTLSAASDKSKIANITIAPASSGSVYIDRLVTAEGMQIMLPFSTGEATTIKRGGISISLDDDGAHADATSWITNISEEDKDGNIASGDGVQLTAVPSADGIEVTTFASDLTSASPNNLFETEDGSDKYEGYVLSPLGTKFLWDKPTSGANKVEIVYSGDESYADVYVAEASATVGTVKDTIKVVTDAEVDSVKDKNLIVVGGSCINTVAASMLGSTTPVCGASWASQTGAGAGKYLIQVAASPVNAEKIAMLIAGYETADTQNAVAKVKEGAVSTEVGTKLVGPVAA